MHTAPSDANCTAGTSVESSSAICAATSLSVGGAWRDLLQAKPNLVCVITDPFGIVCLFNVGAERLFGFQAHEVLRHSILTSSPRQHELPPPASACFDFPSMLALQNASRQHPLSCRGKDGKLLTLDLTVLNLGELHSDQCGYLLLGTHRDLDDGEGEDDHCFNRFLECAPDPIIVSNQAGQIVSANIQSAALFGWPREELIGQQIEVLMPTRYRSKHVGARAGFFAAPRVRPMNSGTLLFGLHKSGREFPIDVSLSHLEQRGDRLVICAIRDISARRKADQKFRDLLEAAPDALLIINQQGEIELVNAQAIKLFGWEREQLVGQNIELLIPERFRAKHADSRGRFFDSLEARAMGTGLESHGQRKDGSEFPMEIRLSPLKADDKIIVIAGVRDISERVRINERLQYITHYDSLTGLPNRTQFSDRLDNTLVEAQRLDRQFAVMLVDLDHFKNINDTLGHVAGDELLAQFSKRLLQCVRARDVVARFGGDEFALILMTRDARAAAAKVAAKIHAALDRHFDLSGHEVGIRASIGIAVHPTDATGLENLLKFADTAMHHAKQAGRDTYRFFTPQMNADALARHELEMELRKALGRGEFELYYQPKVLLQSGSVIGLESLLRWNRPQHGVVSPGVFIPVLEQSGLITQVGNWALHTACRQIAQWMREGVGPIQVSVNISERQFADNDLAEIVDLALNEHGVPPDLLEFELTESSLMVNTEHTVNTLHKLRKRGVQISIDDFGTGYSSLAYLRRFPIDKLKIDIAFIREVTNNADAAAIVRAIIQMAHSLKLDVVAEGVETEAQLAYLRRLHCDQIQGYLLSRPLAVANVERLLSCRPQLKVAHALPRTRQNTLLLVDDEENVLNALQRLLRQDGYQILAAHSAVEALELLALHPVQVILCDQRMPGMNGTTFLGMVKEMYPDTLRIILSGYTDVESILEAINQGAIYRFYTKPWENVTLRKNLIDIFRHYWMVHDANVECVAPRAN